MMKIAPLMRYGTVGISKIFNDIREEYRVDGH
jgi:hypothetical protein